MVARQVHHRPRRRLFVEVVVVAVRPVRAEAVGRHRGDGALLRAANNLGQHGAQLLETGAAVWLGGRRDAVEGDDLVPCVLPGRKGPAPAVGVEREHAVDVRRRNIRHRSALLLTRRVGGALQSGDLFSLIIPVT